MDKKDLVYYIKENKRFPRDFYHYTDYVICMFPLFLIMIGFFPILNLFKHPSETGLLVFLPFIPLGTWLLYSDLRKLKRNLSFETIERSYINFEFLVEKINSNFNLRHIETEKELGIITAHTKTDWFSWGEKITLVIEKGHILINSRPIKQPVTIWADRNNLWRMRQIIGNNYETTNTERKSP